MITTHVLDTSLGRPAAGLLVVLERQGSAPEWVEIGRGETDADGRVRTLVPQGAAVSAGIYRLTFATRAYFEQRRSDSFYPSVVVTFEVSDGGHYHVPLLLSPFGYSTYRGS